MVRAKTKRKVDLVSSHSGNEDNDGPSLICDNEPTGLAQPMLSTSSSEGTYDNLPPHTLPLRLRPGEKLIEYEEYIPPTDRDYEV
ncbi:MAG TPA: hypothetical protein VF884_10745 [Nitrososphaeraceae archaeon]